MTKKHSIEDRMVDSSDEEWDSDEEYCGEGERQCHEVDEAFHGKRNINPTNDHSQTHHTKKPRPSTEHPPQHEEAKVIAYIPRESEFAVCAARYISWTGLCPVVSYMDPSMFPEYISMEDIQYMASSGIWGDDCKMSAGAAISYIALPTGELEKLPDSLQLEDIEYKLTDSLHLEDMEYELPDSLQLEDIEYTTKPAVWCKNSFASTEVAFPSIEGRTFHDSLSLEDIEYMLMSEMRPSYPMEEEQEYKPVYRNVGIYKPYAGDDIMDTEDPNSKETLTHPIKTDHLVPPKDYYDHRPIDYKTNMYIKGIKKPKGGKMHELKVHGIGMAIADICRSNPWNDKLSRDSLMDTFRQCQMMKEDDSRLTLQGPSLHYLTPEYAPQLLQKWYLDDHPDFIKREMDTYIAVKKRIECKYIKNEDPFMFIRIGSAKAKECNTVPKDTVKEARQITYYDSHKSSKAKGYSTVSKDTVKSARQNTYYFSHKLITDKGGGGENPEYETKRCSFVDVWLNDPEILTTQSLCFNPSHPPGLIPADNNSFMYNTWTGFAAEKFNPVSETVEQEAMRVYYGHVVKCVGKEVADYIMDYIANMFQYPCSKTGVAILLQGLQGCGKGTIFDTIRKVMGDQASKQTGNPTQDLFSRFSDGLKHRVLVQVTYTHLTYSQFDTILACY